MRFIEAGTSNSNIMLLIHGMQIPWQAWNEHLKFFKRNYHVIIPILSGHDPDDKSTFLSIQDEAIKIESFLMLFHKKIAILCGVSMGGAISAVICNRAKLQIDHLILDGAPLLPYNTIISNLILKQYLYMTGGVKKRDTKLLAKCETDFMPSEYMRYFLDMIDVMTEETIRNCVNSICHNQMGKVMNFKDINISYYYGTGLNKYYSKKSAKFLSHNYPETKLYCQKGCGHSEFFLYRPEKHISLIIKSVTGSGPGDNS